MRRPTRYSRGAGGLLSKLFLARLENGTMINRATQTSRKNTQHIQVPAGLAKFFRKIGDV